jgi:hypothetical protein
MKTEFDWDDVWEASKRSSLIGAFLGGTSSVVNLLVWFFRLLWFSTEMQGDAGGVFFGILLGTFTGVFLVTWGLGTLSYY